MKRLKNITIILLVAVGILSILSFAKSSGTLLQEGLNAEQVDCDLDAAIKIYEKIIEDSSAQRSHIAQASYRQGMCYLKKQNELKAKEVFGKLVANYSDQSKVVNKVKPLLEELINSDPAALMSPETLNYFEGTWYGALSLPDGAKLKMAIEFEQGKGQITKATIISLDQGAMGIAADEVKIHGNRIRLTIEEDGVVIEGTFDKTSSAISAHWKQGPVNFPLQLKLVESVPGFRRPQTPKRPFPYTEEEVTFTNKAAVVKLAGTLTLPSSKGPHPAAILLQGSGPHGRDEMIFYHRPFLVLADYLTRNGIAVLRYDKRGTNHSTGDYGKATVHDFASDASAAVEYLKTRYEIDSSRIGLIGHSEGGTVAQIVAEKASYVAFIISISGPGISGCDNIILQDLASAKTKGATNEELKLIRQVVEQYYRVPLAEKNNDIARKKMQKIYDDMTDEQRHAYRYLKDGWSNQIDNCLSPGCRSAHEFDPRPILMKVKCPVLAINGALDIQVPPNENLAGIEEALKVGGNTNFTVKELPGLNHLLQTADTGAFAEYNKIEETIAPVALETIGNWIKEHIQ